MEKEKTVKHKSFQFALTTIKTYQYLTHEQKEFVMSKQLLRSGTAIGALIREAEHAESKADFIHKMALAQKEANETSYWLELLTAAGYLMKNTSNLSLKCQEIKKMLASIIISSKKSIGRQ